MKLLIFLPTFNEHEALPHIVDAILTRNTTCHVLVVDDQSTDGTIEYVKAHTQYEQRLFLIVRESLRGRGYTEIDAYRFFLNHDYECLIELDADGSHDPQYIPSFCERLNDHDIVIGSRFLSESQDAERSVLRRITSKMLAWLAHCFLGITSTDPTAGFRGFKRTVVEWLSAQSITAQGPEIIIETAALLASSSFTISELPIQFKERTHGDSKVRFSTLWCYGGYCIAAALTRATKKKQCKKLLL